MRGINRVIISGNVSEDIQFATTVSGTERTLCTFYLASDRHAQGAVVTAWVKVNVYIEALVNLCQQRLRKGAYVIVEGELMNRGEVRAREIIFLIAGKEGSNGEGEADGLPE